MAKSEILLAFVFLSLAFADNSPFEQGPHEVKTTEFLQVNFLALLFLK